MKRGVLGSEERLSKRKEKECKHGLALGKFTRPLLVPSIFSNMHAPQPINFVMRVTGSDFGLLHLFSTVPMENREARRSIMQETAFHRVHFCIQVLLQAILT